MRELNVFSGPDSIRDYLNPGKLPYLPLVEVPEHLNPFRGDGVRIYAKMMTFSTLHSVKAVPAFNMIERMAERGELDDNPTLIENSSGNTVVALTLCARQFGIDDARAIIPSEVSKDKVALLRFFGITPQVNREPDDPEPFDERSGIYKARKQGEEEGWVNPGQYHNPDNPSAHERWIAPQVWQQTKGKLDIFCASLGTTGTIIGNSRYLKGENSELKVLGVQRAPDNYVPGPRTPNLLKLIDFEWEKHVDLVQQATRHESYEMSMKLSRGGIFAGPSSGLAMVGLLKELQEMKERGDFEGRGEGEELTCVFIAADTPIPYFEEYFKFLPENLFPDLEDAHLLDD